MLPVLVSVTFRKKSPTQILHLLARTRLACIEWGGDVHVPPGDIATARLVGDATRTAGLSIAAYGSYYRCVNQNDTTENFTPILAAAAALGAPQIRVWAGQKSSASSTPDHQNLVAHHLRLACQMAADRGIRIVTEWHADTLTDTLASTEALFSAVNHPNLYTYWQPRTRMPAAHSLDQLTRLTLPLAGIHVFHWDEKTGERYLLAPGRSTWQTYLPELRKRITSTTPALLEFVRDESDESLLADAEELCSWQA
jgi:3-dehydroshikimate dehydratase